MNRLCLPIAYCLALVLALTLAGPAALQGQGNQPVLENPWPENPEGNC